MDAVTSESYSVFAFLLKPNHQHGLAQLLISRLWWGRLLLPFLSTCTWNMSALISFHCVLYLPGDLLKNVKAGSECVIATVADFCAGLSPCY